MSCLPTGNEADLVGYWNFNEGSGNTVTDLTSNGNNGTINGASWTTQTPNQYCNNCVVTDSVMVNIIPSPTFALSSDTISQCNTDSVLLDAGTGFASYAWSNGANTQQTYAASNEFYTATVTDANGCSSNDSILVDMMNVSIVQNDTTICEGENIVIAVDTLNNNITRPIYNGFLILFQ